MQSLSYPRRVRPSTSLLFDWARAFDFFGWDWQPSRLRYSWIRAQPSFSLNFPGGRGLLVIVTGEEDYAALDRWRLDAEALSRLTESDVAILLSRPVEWIWAANEVDYLGPHGWGAEVHIAGDILAVDTWPYDRYAPGRGWGPLAIGSCNRRGITLCPATEEGCGICRMCGGRAWNGYECLVSESDGIDRAFPRRRPKQWRITCRKAAAK